MNIGRKELESLSIGAEIIGSGGGGNTYPLKSVLRFYLERNRLPNFVDLEDIPDSSLVVGVAHLGAPMIIEEKLPQGNNLILSIKALESFIGEKTSAIIPIEGAGVNALVPLIAAINSNTPIIDGDGTGRAFPELSMTSFSINGISGAPLSISDDFGNVVVVEELQESLTDELVRGLALIFGGGAWVTAYPMTGQEVKKFCIRKTLSRNIEIGNVLSARSSPLDKIRELQERFGAKLIGEGFVKEIFRYREGKFSKGDLYIECYDNRFLKISYQNEYILITEQEKVIAGIPTIISLLNNKTLQPIRTDEISVDDEVFIITMPAPVELTSQKALKRVGPKAFGYDI
jgi:DUF917 family protein